MRPKLILYITILLIALISMGYSNSKNEQAATVDISSMPSESNQKNETEIEPTSPSEENINITVGGINFDLYSYFDDELLSQLSADELSILRNSIYAKHGYLFTSEKYKAYFSEYKWYVAKEKYVEPDFMPVDHENVKNILAFETLSQMIFKSSLENIRLPGNNDIEINVEGLKTDGNYPTRITLKLDGKQVVFESNWNDGIVISQVDFDKTDQYLDIFITEIGTDIGSVTYIYKYNKDQLFEYAKFDHFLDEFLYDENGSIYFYFDSENLKEINRMFNYKTKESVEIEDKKLHDKLNNLE